jgi:hypothetical protein
MNLRLQFDTKDINWNLVIAPRWRGSVNRDKTKGKLSELG